jgi:hypothetical protein
VHRLGTCCRRDAREDISEMQVVIANTAHDSGGKADEEYKLKARTACPSVVHRLDHLASTLRKISAR